MTSPLNLCTSLYHRMPQLCCSTYHHANQSAMQPLSLGPVSSAALFLLSGFMHNNLVLFLRWCDRGGRACCYWLNVMPVVIDWIGRDAIGLPLLYQLTKTACWALFDEKSKKRKAIGGKRKRDWSILLQAIVWKLQSKPKEDTALVLGSPLVADKCLHPWCCKPLPYMS